MVGSGPGLKRGPPCDMFPKRHSEKTSQLFLEFSFFDHKTRLPGRYWGKTETETTISGFRSLIENAEPKN